LLGGKPLEPKATTKPAPAKKPKDSAKKPKAKKAVKKAAPPKKAAPTKKVAKKSPARSETRRTAAPEVAPQPNAPQASANPPLSPEGTVPMPVKNEVEMATGLREIAVTAIRANPHQPRRDFDPDQLQELADSIRAEGLLQPVVVRALGEGQYELIAGERRWRAVQSLRLKRIPARIITSSDASSAVLSLVENLQRADLNPLEEAMGYASLLKDFNLTQEAVAERIGKARASIANSLRLLQLEREIQGYLAKGRLSTGHAKVLLGVPAGELRLLLARRIIEQGLSVRATEEAATKIRPGANSGSDKAKPEANGSDAVAIEAYQRALMTHFNTKVSLKHTAKKGRLVIEYFGNDDLQRILERMGVGSV